MKDWDAQKRTIDWNALGQREVCGRLTIRQEKQTLMTNEEYERITRPLVKKMADDMMAALLGANAFQQPRPTALRLTRSGAFEVVEIADDGSIIEPPKPCPKCGPVLLCAEHMALIT